MHVLNPAVGMTDRLLGVSGWHERGVPTEGFEGWLGRTCLFGDLLGCCMHVCWSSGGAYGVAYAVELVVIGCTGQATGQFHDIGGNVVSSWLFHFWERM
jgi:hypothetical protein